jgi:preprotein translocase subunit SecG
MFTTLIVFQVLAAAGLIAIVLVQRGPGATMGAAFGSGASGTVFGSRGAGNFLTRTTSWLAVAFFGISLALAVIATGLNSGEPDSALSDSVLEREAERQQQEGDTGAAIESVIEDLDNPEAGEQAATEDSGSQPAGDDSEDKASDLPDPPQGS